MARRLGIIGSGRIGTAVAWLAAAAGIEVALSNSRGPRTLRALAADLGVRAATVEEAASTADVVVAAVPLHAHAKLPVEALAGRTVLDTGNYYPERDGRIAALDSGATTSSELLQSRLPGSRVVKAFNTITPHQLRTLARPADAADRSALPIAGELGAKDEAAHLLDLLGWDAVDIGELDESWRCEPNTPAYVLPYLGGPPAPGVTDFLAWTETRSGVVTPAAAVELLVASAVRREAGTSRIPR
ncbi:NADPH-dependent F420 reductase [Microlunatus sp. GCM10028923]|uniref:NADPH-dependent F420 reductase n=1 Tax=Microlunatus sp. GCM10028923 TaxID=3273400 RepID=UPI00361561AE